MLFFCKNSYFEKKKLNKSKRFSLSVAILSKVNNINLNWLNISKSFLKDKLSNDIFIFCFFSKNKYNVNNINNNTKIQSNPFIFFFLNNTPKKSKKDAKQLIKDK